MKVNKLDKAHEFVMSCIQNPKVKLNDENLQSIVSNAWKYADLMQEECDKRKLKGFTEELQDDWQPDWSQAPKWAKYWCMYSSNGTCYWTESQPIKKWDEFSILRNEQSPTFNYRGDWKQSLRERPKDNKVESGYVQQIPRPFLVNGCDVGNLDVLKEGLRSGLKEASKETTPKVEVKSKQHSCNCPHWKGSSFFMGDTFTCNDCGGVVMI